MPVLTAVESTAGCQHDDTPRNESIVVHSGRLQNVFVYISSDVDAARLPPVPSTPLVLDQLGCIFRPHVLGMRAGRKLVAANNDTVSHNVRVSAKRNDDPNRTIGPGTLLELSFDNQEVAVKFACDIHPWMSAYLCVVDHPYFAVSGPDGSFRIENVPPGKYDLTFWHASRKVRFQRRLRGVVVSPGGDTPVEVPPFKLK